MVSLRFHFDVEWFGLEHIGTDRVIALPRHLGDHRERAERAERNAPGRRGLRRPASLPAKGGPVDVRCPPGAGGRVERGERRRLLLGVWIVAGIVERISKN